MAAAHDRAQRWVACPRCGQKTLYSAANHPRPFCSERCRSLDLGAWASESYRVAETPGDDADGTTDTSGDAQH